MIGLEYNKLPHSFRITVYDLLTQEKLTKRALESDVAKVFELWWFVPTIMEITILE